MNKIMSKCYNWDEFTKHAALITKTVNGHVCWLVIIEQRFSFFTNFVILTHIWSPPELLPQPQHYNIDLLLLIGRARPVIYGNFFLYYNNTYGCNLLLIKSSENKNLLFIYSWF